MPKTSEISVYLGFLEFSAEFIRDLKVNLRSVLSNRNLAIQTFLIKRILK